MTRPLVYSQDTDTLVGEEEEMQLTEEEQIGLAVERLILEASRQLQRAQPQQAEYLLLEGAEKLGMLWHHIAVDI